MRNICIVTATRAEYGYLQPLIGKIVASSDFNLQLVVTGAHLIKEQGYTVEQIKKDGYPIAEEIDVIVDNSSEFSVACTMSRYAAQFAEVFKRLQPNVVCVLGDRYELLPICSAAFIMKIPIAHISGGDVTEGALDDGIRNAVTMLATYHFPGTEDSAKNIIRMRGSDKNVFAVGEPTLDFYKTEKLLSRDELAALLRIDKNKNWILFTYHPETMETLEYNMCAVKNCISVLQDIQNIQIIITKSNTDYGGKEINAILESVALQDSEKFSIFASLGQQNYLSVMKQCSLVMGNSSSGIIETPFLSVPAINIGNRQKGRHQCSNIIQSTADLASIRNAVAKALSIGNTEHSDKNYWGDGNAAERIYTCLHALS